MGLDKKNILVIQSAPDMYGSGRVLLESIKMLIEEGHHVVLAVSYEGQLCAEASLLGCRVEIIPLAIIRRKYFNIPGLINRVFTFRKAWKELIRITEINNIDFVYSNTLSVIIGVIFAKRKELKHIWHIHEIIEKPRLLIRLYARLMSRHSNLNLAVSEAVKRHWTEIDPNIEMIRLYNGFEFGKNEYNTSLRSELQISNETLLVGMVGRVHPVKGHIYFLEIASHLVSDFKNIKFIMVGDAFPGYEYLYEEIEEFTLEKNLSDYVVDLGFKSDVDRILEDLDLFILPSVKPDSLPTVIIEAMASELAVAATNLGGAPELVIEGETGVLIPWNDSLEAASIIKPILSSPERRKEMGEMGRKRVLEKFSRQSYSRNLSNYIEDLVK